MRRKKLCAAFGIFALGIFAVLATISLAASVYAAEVPQQRSDDRFLGNADAPITIFEFFSLTCPHCAHFEAADYPQLKKEWIDTGKAKIIYRDFPLDQNALEAAMVARCVEPKRYADFIEVLFQQQPVWGMQKDPTDALRKIAPLGGISGDKFNQCVIDDALSKAVVGDEFEAQQKFDVKLTPTFFINGNKVEGAVPYDDFVKELEKAQGSMPARVQAGPHEQ